MFLIESNFDEESEIIAKLAMEEKRLTSHGRSKKRRTFIWRDRLQAEENLFCNDFVEPPIYPHNMRLKLTILILSKEEMVPKARFFFLSKDYRLTQNYCLWCYS
jgi:hypothetical protein